MTHKLVTSIWARRGEFATLVRIELQDNDRTSPKKRITHVHMACEICDKEREVSVGVAKAVAEKFDLVEEHPCKPVEEWPERPKPTPRMNPAEQIAKRELLRQKLEEEERNS